MGFSGCLIWLHRFYGVFVVVIMFFFWLVDIVTLFFLGLLIWLDRYSVVFGVVTLVFYDAWNA